MHLRARQAEVPVPAHGLGRREGDPAPPDRADGQSDIAAEDRDNEPPGELAREAEGDGADRHERFVGHGVDHRADDGGLLEAAREVAVNQVGDAGVGEQT